MTRENRINIILKASNRASLKLIKLWNKYQKTKQRTLAKLMYAQLKELNKKY